MTVLMRTIYICTMGEGYRNRGGRGEIDPILADQQSLHISTGQAGGANYARHITTNYSFPRTSKLEVLKQDKLFFKNARSDHDQGSFYCK